MGGEAEVVAEDECVEGRQGEEGLRREERERHGGVEADEGAVAGPRAGEDHARHDESAAEGPDHEHDGLPLREGGVGPLAEGAVGGDAGDERVGEGLRERLEEQRDVESRCARRRVAAESLRVRHRERVVYHTAAGGGGVRKTQKQN